MSAEADRRRRETRFRTVFTHLAGVTDYARRRGSSDPDGIAAETMAIAWRRLLDIPQDDPRPWLYATARNLVYAEWRRSSRFTDVGARALAVIPDALRITERTDALDPNIASALRALSARDREALLLVAWEDLSPQGAAESLGISPVAFRVRFHRARQRFRRALDDLTPGAHCTDSPEPRMEQA